MAKGNANTAQLCSEMLNDIRNGTADLYNEMIEYNATYGSGIDSDITDAWRDAYVALDDYYKLFQEAYNGITLENVTNYATVKTWKPYTKTRTTTAKTAAKTSTKSSLGTTTAKKSNSYSVPNVGTVTPASNTATTKKKVDAMISTQYSKSKESSQAKAKTNSRGPYGDILSIEGSLQFGDKGNSVKILQNALKGLGYYNGEIDGYFDWPTWYAVGAFQNDTLNYDWATDQYGIVGGDTKWQLWYRGYRSGTQNAIAGIHRIDEDGDEYVFTSGNGNRYRMFSGGERVLTASETDFLYQFAKSGGAVLGNIIKAASGNSIGNISNSRAVGDIHMGDIVINGNADQKTVSQIRRAQREGVDYILTQFARLQQ